MRNYIVPLIIFTILTVVGAQMHPLWGDEAETALFGRNILSYGVPRGWDGVNIMGINNGVVLDKHLNNHTSPWGQYYLVAASFGLLGQSSFTARLPFIILSILSVVMVYFLVLRLTHDTAHAALATWMLCLSVPFILFSFQARYYALTGIAALGMYLSLLGIIRNARHSGAFFALSGIAFFYGNYVAFAAFMTSIIVITFLKIFVTDRKAILPLLRRLILPTIIMAACTVPWYVLMKPNDTRGAFVIPEIWSMPVLFWLGFVESYKNFVWNNAFPIASWLGVVLLIWKRKAISIKLSGILYPLGIAVLFLVIMGVFTIVAEVDTSFTHIRYTMPVFPLFIIAVAGICLNIYRWNRFVGIGIVAVYMGTTLWSFGFPRSFLVEYIAEIVRPYKTPDFEVASYLKEHARNGDTAFVNLDRDHEPLIFHLDKKIKFINRVSLVNTRIFPENRRIIPRYIYDFRGEPDWVILFSTRQNDGSFQMFDARDLPREINLSHYEKTALPVYFSDMTRPEMDLRSFKEIVPQEGEMVYIYRRVTSN